MQNQNLNLNNPNNAYMNYTQGGPPMPQITNNAPPTSSQINPQTQIPQNQIPQNPNNINKMHILDQDLYNKQYQNLNRGNIPLNQNPNNQYPLQNNNNIPIQNTQIRQQPINMYPNGVMPPQGQIIVNPVPVMPVMPMPYSYPMMGVPGCIRCGGRGIKMNGMRCPCIGGGSDGEDFENSLALGLAFGMYGPYRRGFW